MADRFAFALGLGYSARAILAELAADGYRIGGTSRDAARRKALAAEGLEMRDFPTCIDELPEGITHLIISTPPGRDGQDAALTLLDGGTPLPASITWIGYLSATSVYGDHGGGWVTETSPLLGESSRARHRIAAEQGWLAHGAEIFRLSGIYGPGRSVFDRLRAGDARRIIESEIVFSRIHVADIAGAVAHAINHAQPGRILNLADNLPAPSSDLVEAACAISDLPLPVAETLAEADLSPMARSFYADSKRVDNSALTKTLGYHLRYPTWREGLDAIWQDEASL